MADFVQLQEKATETKVNFMKPKGFTNTIVGRHS
jgi:hypothetical protein